MTEKEQHPPLEESHTNSGRAGVFHRSHVKPCSKVAHRHSWWIQGRPARHQCRADKRAVRKRTRACQIRKSGDSRDRMVQGCYRPSQNCVNLVKTTNANFLWRLHRLLVWHAYEALLTRSEIASPTGMRRNAPTVRFIVSERNVKAQIPSIPLPKSPLFRRSALLLVNPLL